MSRSRTSSTCSSVPMWLPDVLSTGVPRTAASYEIGVPSATNLTPGWSWRSFSQPAGDRRAEAAKLGRRAAEREFVPLGRGEVPVQRVAGVDANAAMDVDGAMRDPVPAFGGPELRGRDLLLACQARLEPPRGLPHGQPDRLHVDVRVGKPLRHRLERSDRPAELLAVPRMLCGQLERPFGDAELVCADPDGRAIREPARDRAVGGAEQPLVVKFDVRENEAHRAGAVDELLGPGGYPRISRFDAEHRSTATGRGRDEEEPGGHARRDGGFHSAQPPGPVGSLGSR